MPSSNPYRAHHFNVGDVFAGSFEILEELRRARLGTVYLARSEEWERRVRLQIFKKGLDPEGRARHRIAEDWQMLGQLREPSLTGIVEFGETSRDLLYAATEYLDGESLQERLARYGAQQPRRALDTAIQIARALDAAHGADVLHHNLQPEDIVLSSAHTGDESAYVSGFGQIQLVRSFGSDLTRGVPDWELEMYGALRYLSPELVRGQPLDPRADLYAFGLVLYEMLVGTPAVRGQNPREILGTHVAPQPLEFSNLTALPQELRSIVRRCTHKEPGERFQSAEILLRELERAREAMASASAEGAGPVGGERMPPDNEVVRNYEEQLDDMERHRRRADTGRSPSSAAGESDGRGGPRGRDRSPPAGAEAGGRGGPRDRDSSRRQGGRAAGAAGANPNDAPSTGEYASSFNRSGGDADRTTGTAESVEREGVAEEVTQDFLTAGFLILRFALYVLCAGAGFYLAFIVLGAILSHLFEGRSRMLITAALTFVLPILAGIQAFTARGRFRALEGLRERVEHALLMTALMTSGAALIGSFALPGKVVSEIRKRPNWFLNNPTLKSWNRTASGTFTKVVVVGTESLGIYKPTGSSFERTPPAERDDSTADEVSTYTAPEVMQHEGDAGSKRPDAGLDAPDGGRGTGSTSGARPDRRPSGSAPDRPGSPSDEETERAPSRSDQPRPTDDSSDPSPGSEPSTEDSPPPDERQPDPSPDPSEDESGTYQQWN